MRMPMIALTLALAATAATAQPGPRPMLHGADNPVPAGTYAVEPMHTQITWAVSHMGISPFAGTLSQASGTLTIDPAHPEAATVKVTVPIASIQSTSAKLDEELKSADWFDAAKFPTATFTSTKVTTRDKGARIEGMLTLHGVTKPVVLETRLFGSATNMMSKKPSIGFIGRILFQRSQFGVTKYTPMVSDDVELVINAAFERQ